jgi:hypothetical protein
MKSILNQLPVFSLGGMVFKLGGSEYFLKAGDSLYNLNTISLRGLSEFCL